MTGPAPLRSHLARYHTSRRPPEQVLREGWLETGLPAFDIENDKRIRWTEKQVLITLAERLYGKREVRE